MDVLAWYDQATMTDLRDYITTKEAAEILGVGRQRVRDLIRDERLDAIKVGRDWLITRKSVESFERAQPWDLTETEQD